ncbi:MAG: hypothetical protein ACK5KR_06325 [Breznakia sp.]
MDEIKNDSSWEVEEGKVKSVTTWKTLKQVQITFAIETLITIAFIVLCIWAFQQHIAFGVLCLLITMFAGLSAYGSYTAMQILYAQKPAKVDEMKKMGKKKFNIKIPEFKISKIKIPSLERKIEATYSATLSKTSSKDRQEVIDNLVEGGTLYVNENYIVTTKSGLEVGELTKLLIAKIEGIDVQKLRCKVVEISFNKSRKKALRIDLNVLE